MKIICGCLLLIAFVFPLVGQEKRLDSSPQDFRAFFSKFRKLVEKKDKASLVTMMVFPFKYGFDTGDEGTMTKVQFLKNYDQRFAESLKEAVGEQNPLFAEGEKSAYMISTEDAAHLIFLKRRGSFKLVSYLIEP